MASSWRGVFRALMLSGSLMLSARLARADQGATDRENARSYMADGRTKRDAGDLKGALRAFQAADALMHVPTTAFEVARTESMLGQLIEAREEALQIARSQTKPGEPLPFADARAAAQKLADDIEPRIPSIRLVVSNPSDAMTVSIDDVALPAVAVGLARRLNPGSHTIVAKLGSNERRLTVQVLERESKEVPLDLGEATQQTAPPPNATMVTPVEPAATHVDGANKRAPWMAAGVATLAVGGAGIVVGAITGAMSLSQTSSLKSQCSSAGVCPASLNEGIGNARTLATVSNITFIAGGALAIVGTIFMIISTGKSSHPIAVYVGPSSVQLAGKF